MAYSNLAYELQEEEYKDSNIAKKTVRKTQKVIKKNFTPIIYAVILSVAAYYMISKNVAVYETEQEIKALQTELTNLETYTSQRIFELEQSVDLTTIEQIATTKLNMQRPEQYQIEYVSVPRDDVTEITSDEVEGVKSKVDNIKKDFKRNVLGIFSLKVK